MIEKWIAGAASDTASPVVFRRILECEIPLAEIHATPDAKWIRMNSTDVCGALSLVLKNRSLYGAHASTAGSDDNGGQVDAMTLERLPVGLALASNVKTST